MKRKRVKRPKPDEVVQRVIATAIAIAAGVLRVCETHTLTTMAVEGSDLRDAYEFGARLMKHKEMRAAFTSRKQLTHAIQATVAEHRSKVCLLCHPPKLH
jgi:hypothetical protein